MSLTPHCARRLGGVHFTLKWHRYGRYDFQKWAKTLRKVGVNEKVGAYIWHRYGRYIADIWHRFRHTARNIFYLEIQIEISSPLQTSPIFFVFEIVLKLIIFGEEGKPQGEGLGASPKGKGWGWYCF